MAATSIPLGMHHAQLQCAKGDTAIHYVSHSAIPLFWKRLSAHVRALSANKEMFNFAST